MYSLSLLTTTTLVLTIANLNTPVVLAEDDDFVSSIVDTYDLLYNKGVEAYSRKRWFECLTHLNGALTDYRVYRSTLITCKRECRKKSSDDDGALSTKPRITEMQIFFRILKRSNCIRKCKQNHFGNRPDVLASKGIEEEFEYRKPYDFLQYCHYKLDNIKEAVASSYTFLMGNPKHKPTLKNLLYYQRLPGILDDHFIDMERKIFQSLFIKAQEYQMMENWQGVINTIEPAVSDFIKEVDSCELLCEGSYDHEAFPEFINAIADHYISVLKCQIACEDKVSYLHGEKMEGFLPEMYNYLQFAYYQLNNLDSAIKAVASYLLFQPENANMQENKRIYIEKGASPDEVVPRPEAMTYYLHAKQQKSMLKYIKENYVSAFEEEGEESDDVSDLPPTEEDLEVIKPNSSISDTNNFTSVNPDALSSPSDVSDDESSPSDVPETKPVPSDESQPSDIPDAKPTLSDVPDLKPTPSNLPDAKPILSDVPDAKPILSDVPDAKPILPDAKPAVSNVPNAKPTLSDVPDAKPAPSNVPNDESTLSDVSKAKAIPSNVAEAKPTPSNIPSEESSSNVLKAKPAQYGVPDAKAAPLDASSASKSPKPDASSDIKHPQSAAPNAESLKSTGPDALSQQSDILSKSENSNSDKPKSDADKTNFPKSASSESKSKSNKAQYSPSKSNDKSNIAEPNAPSSKTPNVAKLDALKSETSKSEPTKTNIVAADIPKSAQSKSS